MKSKVSITVAPVPTPEPPKVYTVKFDLDLEDAETLLAMTYRIGGDPDKSMRGLFDNIRHSLSDAGVTKAHERKIGIPNGKNGFWIENRNEFSL